MGAETNVVCTPKKEAENSEEISSLNISQIQIPNFVAENFLFSSVSDSCCLARSWLGTYKVSGLTPVNFLTTNLLGMPSIRIDSTWTAIQNSGKNKTIIASIPFRKLPINIAQA